MRCEICNSQVKHEAFFKSISVCPDCFKLLKKLQHYLTFKANNNLNEPFLKHEKKEIERLL